jgi:hypothetical protein
VQARYVDGGYRAGTRDCDRDFESSRNHADCDLHGAGDFNESKDHLIYAARIYDDEVDARCGLNACMERRKEAPGRHPPGGWQSEVSRFSVFSIFEIFDS